MATLPVNELKGVIDLKEEIGSGAYGVVKSVSVHGTVCAAKDVHKILLQNVSKRESTAVKEKFMQECVHCSKLLHPNIVQFLGIYYPSEDAELPWLIMERLDCSLTDYIEKQRNEIYFPVKVSIFHDILLGLQYLHAQNIIHRDLSSNNILLTKYLVAKIADLGMAKLVDPSVIISQSKQPGTPIFMPPEALHDHSRYDSSIDVFSFGCVMIHLMSQELPKPEPAVRLDKSVGRYVVFSQIECREKYLAKIYKPPELKKLILQSIEDFPEKRPSITKLIEYFEIFVKHQTAKGVCLDKDQMISKLQKQVEDYQERIIAQEDRINKLESKNEVNASIAIATLEQEKASIIQSNQKISREVARLMSVDVELQNSKKEVEKYQLELRKAEEELNTKEFILQTYKEDFQQERKDRENAHNIKEEEIAKVQVEKEEWIANHHEDLRRIQENYRGQINANAQKIEELTAVNDKLNQENARVLAALDKQKHGGGDYSEARQFQMQWKEREEIEKWLKEVITRQLEAQRQLHQQLHGMNILIRKKGSSVDPPLSTNMSSHQQQNWQRTMTPAFYPTNQGQLGHFLSMAPHYLPQHDPDFDDMSKHPTSISEGINEEIRLQANLQRRQQQQDEYESDLAYDPYLICHKCNRQFREGQLPEYRRHIDNCHH